MDETGYLDGATGPDTDPGAGGPDGQADPADREEHLTPLDLDGDGRSDAAWGFLADVGEFALLDTDTDGVAEYVEIDTDGDGLLDAMVTADGDGWVLELDLDQDGVVDESLRVTAEELASGVPQLYALLVGDVAVDGSTAPAPEGDTTQYPQVQDGQVVGDPFAYSDHWFQQAFDGSCLPASVAQIYSAYTGEPVTDLDFVDLANEVGGWIVDDAGVPGLRPEAAVELLERVGIDATVRTSDLEGLTTALGQGYAVMVAVDSGEIWYGEATEDDAMDHAVLVAGVDEDAGVVYLSDTGTADGNVLEVPLDTFLDSWRDSGNTMVVTEETVAEHRGEALAEPAPEPAPEDVVPVPATDSGRGPFDDATQAPPQTPDRGVVGVLVDRPWILLPVALAGVRLVTRRSR